LILPREARERPVTAQLTIPLYEAGAVYSQTRQAVATVKQRQGQTDDARRAALQGVTQAWEAMDAARDNIHSWQESVRAGEVARDSVKIEQQVGARTVLDVLNAELELFSDRVSLANVEHDLAVAQFNLTQQIGRLTAADLALPVPLYDVGGHYRGVRDKWGGFDAEDAPPDTGEIPPSGLLDTTMDR
jgi:outer membrane protein